MITPMSTATDTAPITGPVVIVGRSFNRVEQPLLAYPSYEAAVADLATVGIDFEGRLSANVDDVLGDYSNNTAAITKLWGEKGFYYGGCGGIYTLVVRPFEMGKPLAFGFDLD